MPSFPRASVTELLLPPNVHASKFTLYIDNAGKWGQILSARIRWLFVERILSVECKQVSCMSGEETMKTDVSKTNTREELALMKHVTVFVKHFHHVRLPYEPFLLDDNKKFWPRPLSFCNPRFCTFCAETSLWRHFLKLFFWTHFRLSLWMAMHMRMRRATPSVYLDLACCEQNDCQEDCRCKRDIPRWF